MQMLAVQIPVELPSADRIEEIIREAATAAAKEQLRWLDSKEAAAHWGVSERTFERKKKKLGLPVCKVDGVNKFLRDDLDAALLSNMVHPKVKVIEFPSLSLRETIRKVGVA